MNIKFSSSHNTKEPENILYIVGTPIGNLSDLSYRALNILKMFHLLPAKIRGKQRFFKYDLQII